ncbi:hypothetical protein KUTeg_017812 [Tegillarca granosa]|uniref:GON-4-like protein n=1 Tax=Tegillarca granosa TaxID=220873 RepID=A0ABQ9EHK7_TEGGR|nr:hypothetical protein KUTeg_017812 [Tegillarca granosa]
MEENGNCKENTSGSLQQNMQLKSQENVPNLSSNLICTPPPSKYGSDYFFTPQTVSKSGVYSDIGNNEVVCTADTPVARPKSPFNKVTASTELSTINFGDINIGNSDMTFPSTSIQTTPASSLSSCFKTPTGPSSLSRVSVVTSVPESATSSQIRSEEGRHESRKPARQNITKKIKDSLIRRREKYKSPVKKFISRLQGRGVKRSPSKNNPVKPKRRKRLSGVKELGTKNVGDSSEGEYADNDMSDDDSSDEHWEIMEESETEMDRKLEENASKCNLTAVNVKNILHQVITNEAVVAMVKNTLMSEEQSPEDKDILYEPKMTRAKMKEVLEKEGEGHRPWPLTPIKETKSKATSFLELELPDDEEDEEYNPEKDKELGSLSDEDSESVASSQSHFGSPCPRTPITPRSRLSDLDTTPSVRGDDDSLLSPMGPPTSSLSLSSQRQNLGQKFNQAMEEHERKQREEETIALRTRSKFSLTDTSLTELEQNFVAPDITADMYDTNCNDSEWQMFLQSLVVPTENEDTNDGCDDETNDPEYDYLEDINEEENIDKEEIRCDRAVRVSKREMNELMDELFEAYEDLDLIEEKEKEVMKMKVLNNMMSSKKTKSSGSVANYLKITDQERIQIDDQMRKHVQLLSQSYVLGLDDPEHHKDLINHSKFLINELDRFSKSNTPIISHSSAYKACNLDDAVRLVNENINYTPDVKPTKSKKRSCLSERQGSSIAGSDKSLGYLISKHYLTLSKQQKDEIYDIIGAKEGKTVSDPSVLLQRSTLPNLSEFQKDLIWNSSIFIHPELLPHGKLQVTPQTKKNKRVSFTEAEDNLLAIGMDEFKKLPLYRQLIQKFLVPCKTDEQIKIRIKNLGANKTQDNAVKFYKKNKTLPKFIRYTDPFSFSQIKPPRDQSQTYQPTWCKELKIKEIILSNEKEDENSGIKRSSSVNIPVPNSDGDDKDEEKSQSAPVTPSQRTMTDRPQPLTAIKVISHEIDDMDSGLSNMSWPSPTKLRKAISSNKSERLQLCKSPGFIPLHPGMSDVESGPKSPINVRILDRDNIGSPSPLVCDNLNHNSDGKPSSISSVPPSVVITLGNNVNSLVTCIGTTNSFSFTNTRTTSVSGTVNYIKNPMTNIDTVNSLNVFNTMPITSVGNSLTNLVTTDQTDGSFSFPKALTTPNVGVANNNAGSGPGVMVESSTNNFCILTSPCSSGTSTSKSNVTSFTNIVSMTSEPKEQLMSVNQLKNVTTGVSQLKNVTAGVSQLKSVKTGVSQLKSVTTESNNSNITCVFPVSGNDQSQNSVPFLTNPTAGIINRDNTSGDDRKNTITSSGGMQANELALSLTSQNSKTDLIESELSDNHTISKPEMKSEILIPQPSVITGPFCSSTVGVKVPSKSLNTVSVVNTKSVNLVINNSDIDRNTNTNAITTKERDNSSSECPTATDENIVKLNQGTISVPLSQTDPQKILTFTTNADAFFATSLPFESYSSTNHHTGSVVCSTSSEIVMTTTLTTSGTGTMVTSVSNSITSMSSSVTESMSNIYEDGMRTPEKENMPLHNLSTPESCTSLSSFVPSLENTPAKYQQIQETTPKKSTPSPHFRPIAPKPNTPPPTLQLDIPKRSRGKRSSPRKISFQQQARAICPKGFVIKTYVSPSKTAASSIKNRVLRRGIKILPTPLDMPKKKLHITVKPSKGKKLQEVEEEGVLSRNDTASEYDTMESEYMSDDNVDENTTDTAKTSKGSARKNQKNRKSRRKRNSDSCKSLESDDTQSETEEMSQDDSQNEEENLDDEDHMATLMAASTTIGFASKKLNSKEIKDNRSKAKKRKDATLAMLASNLLRTDPHKDDRDTAFAQSYLNKAREVLKDDIDRYEKFLKILYDFGKSELSPVELYKGFEGSTCTLSRPC